MTPDEAQQLQEVYDFMQQLKHNGFYPIRSGSKSLTQVVTDSRGDTSTVPAAYAGTEIIAINGRPREIPFL